MKFVLTASLLVFTLKLFAQSSDTTKFYNKNYGFKSYVVPVVLVVYGLSSFNDFGFPSSQEIKNYRQENFSTFKTTLDDYLVFTPGLMLLGLDVLNVKSTSSFANQAAITCKSVGLSLAVVYALKFSTQVLRPNNTNKLSFPSGHTAFAFTLAEVLHQEYKDKPIVYVTGYTLASAAGAMRILNNEHWFTDVLVGAGIGIAASKFVYATHQYKWKMNKGGFLPIIGSNQAGFLYTF